VNKFEDQLFTDLMREHGEELATVQAPVARRTVRRPVWVAAGAAGVAAVVTTGWGLVDNGTPAYAVDAHADGTVTVSLTELLGLDGANAELRKLGVAAAVVPMRADCTERQPPAVRVDGKVSVGAEQARAGRPGSFTLDATSIPPGDTAVLGAQQRPNGDVVLSFTVVRGAAPTCVPELPVPGPRGGGGPAGGTDSYGTQSDGSQSDSNQSNRVDGGGPGTATSPGR
jgi:hypothetical protein